MTVIVPEQTPAGEAHLEPFLVELVHESLNSYAYSNAAFLCERLHAAAPTEVSRDFARVPPSCRRSIRSDGVTRRRPIPRASPHLDADPLTARPRPPTHPRTQANAHLLATCYYRADQANRAYHTLKGRTSPKCRYLFALCCVKLRRLPEAEAALCRSPLPAGGRPPATDSSAAERPAANARATSDVPNGAHGLYLLGRVCKETGRDKAAAAHFADALALDPFMWCAYEELCALGAEAEAEAATEAALRSADRYPKLADLGKLGADRVWRSRGVDVVWNGTYGGETTSAATNSEGTSGLSGGGAGGEEGALTRGRRPIQTTHSAASSEPWRRARRRWRNRWVSPSPLTRGSPPPLGPPFRCPPGASPRTTARTATRKPPRRTAPGG